MPTKVDEAKRQVIEFNNEPATVAYAKALGVNEAELADLVFKNPVGLIFNETEPFVRSPRVIEGTAINFYCAIKQDVPLKLLNSGNIVDDTAVALAEMTKKHDGLKGIINFNCILRTLDLKNSNQTAAYGQLFDKVPTVGFSTYGESYIAHINQTATMVLFGNKAA